MPFDPTTAASVASGCTGFMKAAFGFRPDFFFLATASLLRLRDAPKRPSRGAYHETSRFFRGKYGRRRSGGPGQIALSRSDGTPVSADSYLERMHFSVEFYGRKSERVLMMQFIGDPGERRRHVVGGRQLEVAAAGRRGDFRQALVGV